MSDRSAAEITFGGGIIREDLPELCVLISSVCDTVRMGQTPYREVTPHLFEVAASEHRTLTVEGSELVGGVFADVVDFCIEHNIDFLQHSSGTRTHDPWINCRIHEVSYDGHATQSGHRLVAYDSLHRDVMALIEDPEKLAKMLLEFYVNVPELEPLRIVP